MAKNKGQQGSMSGWFRTHYRQNPDDLNKPNDVILAMWQEANGGEEITGRVRNAMANVKSSVKKEMGLGRKKKKAKVAKAAAGDGTHAAEAAKPVREKRSGLSGNTLEALEFEVDRCLMMARVHGEHDPEMAQVARMLHRARNEIILIQGKP